MSLSVIHNENHGISSALSNQKTLTGNFLYREHRTNRKGRLVLEFMHGESHILVAMFFNVRIESQRTGKKYPVGRGGQFTCNRNFKFGRLWERLFDKQPYRWCRAHHELSKLRNMSLEGEAVLKQKEDGMGDYWEMIKLKLCE